MKIEKIRKDMEEALKHIRGEKLNISVCDLHKRIELKKDFKVKIYVEELGIGICSKLPNFENCITDDKARKLRDILCELYGLPDKEA